MTARIITYFSRNADPKQQWMGFIETSKGRLGIWFPGETEEEVKQKVRNFWATEKPKMERRYGRPKKTSQENAVA